MSKIHNPHDKFFTLTFDKPEVGKDFLRNELPEKIARLVDFSSIELTKDSFIDKNMNKYYSDKLFKAKLKNGKHVLFYALIEHKSYPEKFVDFQVLKYEVRIWETIFNEHEAKKEEARKLREQGDDAPDVPPLEYLPPIIPIVLYHGASEWKIPLNFRSKFPDDLPVQFNEFIPDFKYILCDLSDEIHKTFKGAVTYQIAMLLLKHIFDPEILENLPKAYCLLQLIENKQAALELLESMTEYVTSGSEKVTEEDANKLIETYASEIKGGGGDIMPTLAEKWFSQGEENGKKEGKIEVAINLIKEGLDFDLILKATGLPRNELLPLTIKSF